MAKEIERKFLVADDSWRQETKNSLNIRQAYLANTALSSIRIRIVGATANLNVKSAVAAVSREEYEYELPLDDAEEMLKTLCIGEVITKTRHHIQYAGKLWEIDEFDDANRGLIIAEIELIHEGEAFEKPPWLGREVSHLPRYYNPSLLENPYSAWSLTEREES